MKMGTNSFGVHSQTHRDTTLELARIDRLVDYADENTPKQRRFALRKTRHFMFAHDGVGVGSRGWLVGPEG